MFVWNMFHVLDFTFSFEPFFLYWMQTIGFDVVYTYWISAFVWNCFHVLDVRKKCLNLHILESKKCSERFSHVGCRTFVSNNTWTFVRILDVKYLFRNIYTCWTSRGSFRNCLNSAQMLDVKLLFQTCFTYWMSSVRFEFGWTLFTRWMSNFQFETFSHIGCHFVFRNLLNNFTHWRLNSS